MADEGSSQSQASYLNINSGKPQYQEASSTYNLLDEQAATKTMGQICAAMLIQQGQQFQALLQSLNMLFQKGYTYLFMTQILLMRKMMNHFTKLGKLLQEQNEEGKTQIRMLFILSIIAQILRNNPKFYYPFTRKFLMTVFSIDAELLQNSPLKKDILAILAVVYENLSRQPKLIHKYKIEGDLKLAVLGNYEMIEEVFTLKNMNKTICNLTKKGLSFTVADYKKYNVLETVQQIISKNQMELFMTKIKMTMLCAGGNIPIPSNP